MKIRNSYLLFAGTILFIYFLPFILSGENSNTIIHDNLDNNVAQYIVFKNEGVSIALDPNTKVEGILGGQPRMFFLSGLSVQAFLFVLFSPFTAYLINFIFVHIVAFVGMNLLLSRHILKEPKDDGIVAFTSLAFSLIPFYTIYGISVAGIPLLLYAFLNLRNGRNQYINFILISLFAFYSYLVLVGVFAIASIGVIIVYDYKVRGIISKSFLRGFVLLIALYLISDYQLFYQFIFSGVKSNRLEFIPETFDFVTVIDNGLNFFYNLHYHVSQPVGFIFILSIVAIFFGITHQHRDIEILVYLLGLNLLFAFVQSIASWEMLKPLWNAVPLTLTFQWNRFYFLSPFLWFLILVFSMRVIRDSISFFKYSNAVLIVIGLIQIFCLWKYNSEFRETSYNLVASKKIGWSFKNFYDGELFVEIRNFIGKPMDSYRVGSLGIHPSVAQVNGFRTVDGYSSIYPLDYKRNFRKIIAAELDKAPHLKNYFDGFGNRCYFFSSELSHNFTSDKQSNQEIKDLRYDFNEGPVVNYLLSSVKISNPIVTNLRYLRSFERPDSKWRIFLYKIQSNNTFDDENCIQLKVTAEISRDDTFILYHTTADEQAYDDSNSLRVNVKGLNQVQTLVFKIPDSNAIKKLRLDVGLNQEQGLIKFNKIEIVKRGKTLPINLNALRYNRFISIDGNNYKLTEVDNLYYPYFEFDDLSIEQLNSLRQK